MAGLKRIVTDDEADWRILQLANDKAKFAVQLGLVLEEQLQAAFERGIDNDWWTLVDIATMAHGPVGMPMRLFKLTEEGLRRRADLVNVFGDS